MPPIPGNAALFVSTGVNMRPTFFGCEATQNQSEYPIIIYLPNSPPLDGSAPATKCAQVSRIFHSTDIIFSTGDTQFSYTSMFTAVFINQAFMNTLGSFKPNTISPDPNWGKCLQCVAIDRAVPARSNVCAQCFEQYCYDPTDPPSKAELPSRQLSFVNPDPGGLDKIDQWLERNKASLAGWIVAVVLIIAGIVGFM